MPDESCKVARTTERNGLRLQLWTCSAPRPVDPEPAGWLCLAPVVEWVGSREWEFFYVSGVEVASGLARAEEPGWYFRAVEPEVGWISNGPVGPFPTLDAAIEDVRLGG